MQHSRHHFKASDIEQFKKYRTQSELDLSEVLYSKETTSFHVSFGIIRIIKQKSESSQVTWWKNT